ncbi:uracil-DNA glycosylase [Dentipellis sp. KUC8613]|nr:uracil-DNA glycosylase [Dentipellis sp. KUC8613]
MPLKVEAKAALRVKTVVKKSALSQKKLVVQNGRLVSVSVGTGAPSSSSAASAGPSNVEEADSDSKADAAPRKRRRIVKEEEQSDVESEGAEVSVPTPSTSLETLEKDTMHASWYDALKDEFKKPYFAKLKEFLKEEHKAHTVYPPLRDVYSWSRLTPLDKVKVVVIGQDPYHNVNQAHGLAFSVLHPTKPPPSLKNIYKQIQTDIPDFRIPTRGDLTPLATRGVLFLNTALTVRAHKANSHAGKGWEQLTTAALRAVAAREGGRGVVFFAWGAPAQKTCKAVGIDEKRHLVLKSAHPSPLSAYRGFFGNGHFKRANEWLEEKYGPGEGIDWAALHD